MMGEPRQIEGLNPNEDRLLTIHEVSRLTGLSVGTLYHFVSQRRIPVVRLSRRCIRFRMSELQRWWDECAEPVTAQTLRGGHWS
jgi:excisionase family DNA binding protein